MKKVFQLLALCVLISTVACKKDNEEKETPVDETAPELTIMAPVDSTGYLGGNEVMVKALCQDDTELASLTISVSKEASAQAMVKSVKNPWEPTDMVINLEGTEQSIDEVFDVIPTTVQPGVYNMLFLLEDAAGNKTSTIVPLKIELD